MGERERRRIPVSSPELSCAGELECAFPFSAGGRKAFGLITRRGLSVYKRTKKAVAVFA